MSKKFYFVTSYLPSVSITRQRSTNWPVCICCRYSVMILWGLIQLVSLFQNSIAKPTFLCWHWVTSLTGCFYVQN